MNRALKLLVLNAVPVALVAVAAHGIASAAEPPKIDAGVGDGGKFPSTQPATQPAARPGGQEPVPAPPGLRGGRGQRG